MSTCASATPSSVPVREATAVTTPESNPSNDGPKLTAEELGKRFLQLLEGLESREHLSRERVETALGVPLRRFDGTPDYLFAYSQPLEDGWYFSVDFISGSASLKRGVRLQFGKPGERFAQIPADVCALDFDYYHNALEQMGFRGVPIHGEIGQLDFWRYYKGDITLSILPQSVVAGEAGRLCVKSIGTLN
jgi:hypothetical protein